MQIRETILAYGHENIQASHKTTLEITKESWLSKKGDCIIAVSADKAITDFSSKFKDDLRKENAQIAILIETEGITEVINAFGSPRLILAHPTDIVVRKSDYICDRTLAVRADKAACDLSRRLVKKLLNPKEKVKITIIAEV
jgi:hypothetical protein